MASKASCSVDALPLAASLAALRALGRSASSMLGPHRTLKAYEADGTEPARLAGGVMELIGSASEHPAALLLLEACEALERAHGSGTTTLVCLTAELAGALHALRAEGHSLPHTLAALRGESPPVTPNPKQESLMFFSGWDSTSMLGSLINSQN